MKIRKGFVSNSSSSSFMIKKSEVSLKQLELVRNFKEEFKRMRDNRGLGDYLQSGFDEEVTENCLDLWELKEDDEKIICSTFMDNFLFDVYLTIKCIPYKDLEWGDDV